MSNDDVIFVDNSILSAFATCEEKGRLGYVEHLQPKEMPPPLVFGTAFHAAIAAYSTAIADGIVLQDIQKIAREAFITEVKKAGPGVLPLSADSEEKRSVERGLYIIDGYIKRWFQDDTTRWRDVINPIDGKPYVEMGFAMYFMSWQGRPVVYVGKIDRIRRNRVDGMLYDWETKTTGSGVRHYVEQVRPNHQITGYNWVASELLHIDISGTIFDVAHISTRKVDGKFPNGVDIDKDFARVETRRSKTDIQEFLYDLELITTRFLTRQGEGLKRWHRNAPSACYMYGGCYFRKVCGSNLNQSIVKNDYEVRKWAPWEELIKENVPVVLKSEGLILPSTPKE